MKMEFNFLFITKRSETAVLEMNPISPRVIAARFNTRFQEHLLYKYKEYDIRMKSLQKSRSFCSPCHLEPAYGWQIKLSVIR